MKKILVTGANGQLGAELREIVLHQDQPFEYIFTDVELLDITDEAQVSSFFDTHQFDFCINCAAYTAVDKAEEDIQLAERINITGVNNLANACHKNDAVLIHISTDFVFSGQQLTAYTETDVTGPVNKYGEGKLLGEQKALASNPKSIIIRTAWLYSSFGKNFVKTILRLADEREELGVVGDQIGTPTYAYDLAQSILTIIRQLDSQEVENPYGVYHFSNMGVASWYDFAASVLEYAQKDHVKLNLLTTEQFPTPAKRPAFSVLDKTKIASTFGLMIPEWRTSLANCIKKINK